jgi:diguanylate cyclase (GGDEF)-like protein
LTAPSESERVQQLELEVSRLKIHQERQIEKLRSLNVIGRSIAGHLEVQPVLDLACELMNKDLGCDLASIMLIEGDELVMKAARGIPDEVAKTVRVKLGHGYAGRVAQSGQPLLVTEGTKKPEDTQRIASEERRARYHDTSFAVVPLVLEGKVTGVLNVTNKKGGGLGPEDLEFLETVAAYAAVAIENARLHERAQLLAATDGLTELYNHRHFQERLAEEVERWRRYWVKGVALIMLDLDRFKRFNDTYGHRAGDAVLREAAKRLRRQARKVDVCCRYGGEEFAVILPEVGPEGAMTFANRVREAISNTQFEVREGLMIDITVSIGVACCPEDAMDPAELVEAADRALFASKDSGRNRVTAARRTPQPVEQGVSFDESGIVRMPPAPDTTIEEGVSLEDSRTMRGPGATAADKPGAPPADPKPS